MAYTLEQFCEDCRRALETESSQSAAVNSIATRLQDLLVNQAFVETTFSPDNFTKKVLHHDAEKDFYVLAHVHDGPHEGPPHSHGASWAVYGTAKGVTGMKEWERVNPEGEEASVLRVKSRYDLGAGQTRGYGPHAIHSTIHPLRTWVVRVTGTNLDEIPRYRFKKGRDQIVEAV